MSGRLTAVRMREAQEDKKTCVPLELLEVHKKLREVFDDPNNLNNHVKVEFMISHDVASSLRDDGFRVIFCKTGHDDDGVTIISW